jgi:hypothetical protein
MVTITLHVLGDNLSKHLVISASHSSSLNSTFGAKGLTCKNTPWKKLIIWRSRSSRNSSTSGGGAGGGSNVQITLYISHGQIYTFQVIHIQAPTEHVFKNKVPELEM